MKIFRGILGFGVAGLASLSLLNAPIAHSSVWSHLCYEACDGEVVVVEPLDYTNYIFPDRDYDDLANKTRRTVEDMDYLIDHVLSLHPDSAFKGLGQAFIVASNATGLDPLFFFSLAGVESAWGTNETHIKLCNPYSIGMFGDGIHHGWNLSDTFEEAIVEGAKFIYYEYYKKGQTTLYSMNHVRGHSYCDGDSDWEYQIGSEMSYLADLLAERSENGAD